MSTPAITAAAQRRQDKRRRQRARRPGPVLRDEDITFEELTSKARRRTSLPVQWPGGGRFSDNAGKLNQLHLVRLAKRCHLLDDLRETTDYSLPGGRPREAGEAILAYLAFTVSNEVDLQPWWSESEPELWWECGFSEKPRYELIRDRFLELEHLAIEEIYEASAKLIRHAIERSAGLAAFDLYIDCTEAESNVRLHHDCQDGENCPGWKGAKELERNRHRAKPAEGGDRLAPLASTDEIRRTRQSVNRDEFDPDGDMSGDAERAYLDEERGVYRVRLGGHWWRCRDMTAGVRAITGRRGAKKAWAGFYSLKVVCRTFSLPITHIIEAADIQEYDLFDEALERSLHITGEGHVRSLGFDAGFAIKDVYRACTERGITGIGPYRRHKLTNADKAAGITENDTPHDHDEYDRDGIPRCKHCGSETQFVRFARKPKPRVWFTCARPTGKCACRKKNKKTGKSELVPIEQSLMLGDTDPRYVLPLWRNTAAYQALQEVGITMERAHHLARVRSRVGTKGTLNRPKRIGRDTQQLRANASVIADWLRFLFRQGWLPQTILRGADPWAPAPFDEFDGPALPRARGTDTSEWHGREVHATDLGEEYVYTQVLNREEPYLLDGSEFVRRMLAERRRERLDRPYGPAAKRAFGADAPDRPVRISRKKHEQLDQEQQTALQELVLAGGEPGQRFFEVDPETGELVEYFEMTDPETGEILLVREEELPAEVIQLARERTERRPDAAAAEPEDPPPDGLRSRSPGIHGRPSDETAGPN